MRIHSVYSRFVAIFLFSLVILLSPEWAGAKSNLTDAYNELLWEVTLLSVLLFVFVVALWIYHIVKYRDVGQEPQEVDPAFLVRMQRIWIAVSVIIGIILLVLSMPALMKFNNSIITDPAAEQVVVEGTAAWQWKFHKDGQTFEPVKDANGISTTNITLTAGTTYTFVLYSSGNLIHSFFVYELNFKMDVVPHKNNTITITIEEPGVYQVLCAEYCGAGHSMMRGFLIVEAA